jgi:hypothetical protein
MRRDDFPPRGPVRLIADGGCQGQLDIAFDHAFLTPEGPALTLYAAWRSVLVALTPFLKTAGFQYLIYHQQVE